MLVKRYYVIRYQQREKDEPLYMGAPLRTYDRWSWRSSLEDAFRFDNHQSARWKLRSVSDNEYDSCEIVQIRNFAARVADTLRALFGPI